MTVSTAFVLLWLRWRRIVELTTHLGAEKHPEFLPCAAHRPPSPAGEAVLPRSDGEAALPVGLNHSQSGIAQREERTERGQERGEQGARDGRTDVGRTDGQAKGVTQPEPRLRAARAGRSKAGSGETTKQRQTASLNPPQHEQVKISIHGRSKPLNDRSFQFSCRRNSTRSVSERNYAERVHQASIVQQPCSSRRHTCIRIVGQPGVGRPKLHAMARQHGRHSQRAVGVVAGSAALSSAWSAED